MTYEQAMQAYSNGLLPFEELMDMKSELIQEEKIECDHPACARYYSDGLMFCEDCEEEVPSMFSPDGDGEDD